MVKHYEDPLALAAARAMRPKKYLVYLELSMQLPWPKSPWFRFKVCPIGTTLRPEDKERGITSDMVIPIFPNTHHPGSFREPIRTHPEFPFSNCYHWVKTDLMVRIRRTPAGFDETRAIGVDVIQHMAIDELFWEDYDRIYDFLRDKRLAAAAPPLVSETSPPDSSSVHRTPHETSSADADNDDVDSLPAGPDDVDLHSVASKSSHRSEARSEDSVAALLKMDMFGFSYADTVEFDPLVDMWYELTDHLTADTIPCPVGLYKEWETIMQIIHDAQERNPSVKFPPRNPAVVDNPDGPSEANETSSDGVTREKAKPALHVEHVIAAPPHQLTKSVCLWRRLRQKLAGRIHRPTAWGTRPPCLPFWP
ncbi:hypothetical protein OH77DRAFT_1430794 [Trametes cingulata]|nr:hypothetical protein OH77DRAFT_1430794 [Trametes cingulata]